MFPRPAQRSRLLDRIMNATAREYKSHADFRRTHVDAHASDEKFLPLSVRPQKLSDICVVLS
jgi:hypothetical protein